MKRSKNARRRVLEFLSVKYPCQSGQVHRRDRISRRFRSIVILFHPEQDIDGAFFGAEIAALGVSKKSIHLNLQFARPLKPANIKISFVQIQEPLDQE